jgi:hypothetical protein
MRLYLGAAYRLTALICYPHFHSVTEFTARKFTWRIVGTVVGVAFCGVPCLNRDIPELWHLSHCAKKAPQAFCRPPLSLQRKAQGDRPLHAEPSNYQGPKHPFLFVESSPGPPPGGRRPARFRVARALFTPNSQSECDGISKQRPAMMSNRRRDAVGPEATVCRRQLTRKPDISGLPSIPENSFSHIAAGTIFIGDEADGTQHRKARVHIRARSPHFHEGRRRSACGRSHSVRGG